MCFTAKRMLCPSFDGALIPLVVIAIGRRTLAKQLSFVAAFKALAFVEAEGWRQHKIKEDVGEMELHAAESTQM